jgi:hypothetical protein
MLPAIPQPHDRLCVKGLSAHIVIWAMERPNRLHVVSDFSVDGRVRVSLGRGIRVEDDIRFSPSPCGTQPMPQTPTPTRPGVPSPARKTER